DDAAGVTAAFNRNVLCVLNRELHADFDLDAYQHVALWDPGQEWIEMRLRAEPVASGEGSLPRRASLGSVTPERVILTALKPRGNPLAAGLPGGTGPAGGITVRL